MAVGWSKELAKYGIRVAAIAPGLIDTPLAEQLEPEILEMLKASVPLERIGDPEDIAHTVKYIIENDYFTGRILEVDGGLRL